MQIFHLILNFVGAIIAISFQQGLLIGLGIIIYGQHGLIWGILIWILTIPMLYFNYWTWKYVFRYGVIKFITANADTSEIDVLPEHKPYNDPD